MGLLDDVPGVVTQAVGGSGAGQSNLANEVLGLLSGAGQGGGLQGVVQTLKEKGLGDIVSSWVGAGQNLPVSAEQLESGLGADLIGQLASKVGVPADVATAKLTERLPAFIDKLTPNGQIPSSDLLQQGLNLLRSNLAKT